jgi:hypothetical protein
VGKGTELGQFVTGLFIRWKSTDERLGDLDAVLQGPNNPIVVE